MNVVLRSAVLMALVAGTTSIHAQTPAKTAAASVPADKQNVSIMIGMDIANHLQPIKGEIDLAILTKALARLRRPPTRCA